MGAHAAKVQLNGGGIKDWFREAFEPHPTTLSNLVGARARRSAAIASAILSLRKRLPHLLL